MIIYYDLEAAKEFLKQDSKAKPHRGKCMDFYIQIKDFFRVKYSISRVSRRVMPRKDISNQQLLGESQQIS